MRFVFPALIIAASIPYFAVQAFWLGLTTLVLGLYILDDCLKG